MFMFPGRLEWPNGGIVLRAGWFIRLGHWETCLHFTEKGWLIEVETYDVWMHVWITAEAIMSL